MRAGQCAQATAVCSAASVLFAFGRPGAVLYKPTYYVTTAGGVAASQAVTVQP